MDESLAEPPIAGRSAEHWVLFGLAVLVPVALVVAAVFLEPDGRGHGTHEQLGLPSCMTMDVFGVPCPGCGVTTAVTLAAHGRFGESLATQPFGLVVLVVGLLFSAWGLTAHVRGRDLWLLLRERRLGRWGVGLGSALVLAWAYKLSVS